MATKTSPSRRSSSRGSSHRRTKKKPARRRPARRKAPPKTPVHQILSPHARDALGIFLVVLALVAVLGARSFGLGVAVAARWRSRADRRLQRRCARRWGDRRARGASAGRRDLAD